MSFRDVKNGLFEAMTPATLKPVYEEHGREIANAESAARTFMAPYLFYTAARGQKGLIPGAVRGIKTIMDGHDGFVAEHDREFETAKPVIFSSRTMMLQAARDIARHPDIRGKARAIVQALHETDGKTLDQECDKDAQIADQLGCSVNGDLSWAYTGLNIVRNSWVKAVRKTYRELGVKKAGGAVPVSQIKTVVMDAHQTAEATGLLDKAPALRKPLEAIGIGLAIYSAADIMVSNENAYLKLAGENPDTVSFASKLFTSAGRTALYLTGGLATDQQPELASRAA